MGIAYVVVALIVGWLIGFLDSNMRTSKKIEAAEARAELAASEAEKKIAEALAQISSTAPARMSEPSLLSLVNVNNVPFLELDGAPVNPGNISADQKKRLFELLALVHSWVESGHPPQPGQKLAGPVGPGAGTPPFHQGGSAQGVDSAAPAPHPTSAEVKAPQPSTAMVQIAQIDAVLQARLANTPLEGMGIRLTERTSSGGLQVFVGSQKYSTLADVPDPQIKAAVRAAIAEWEQKHSPPATGGAQSPAAPPGSGSGLSFANLPPPAKPADEKEFRALSIVVQIDTVLQSRLENTSLAQKGIRLIERTAMGGVEVYVGNQKYPSLDDVPDQQIKDAIRAAITEWEKKYTPRR